MKILKITSWWFQPTHLKNMSQIGKPSPKFGVKIKNIWVATTFIKNGPIRRARTTSSYDTTSGPFWIKQSVLLKALPHCSKSMKVSWSFQEFLFSSADQLGKGGRKKTHTCFLLVARRARQKKSGYFCMSHPGGLIGILVMVYGIIPTWTIHLKTNMKIPPRGDRIMIFPNSWKKNTWNTENVQRKVRQTNHPFLPYIFRVHVFFVGVGVYIRMEWPNPNHCTTSDTSPPQSFVHTCFTQVAHICFTWYRTSSINSMLCMFQQKPYVSSKVQNQKQNTQQKNTSKHSNPPNPQHPQPIGSMYLWYIYLHEWLIF